MTERGGEMDKGAESYRIYLQGDDGGLAEIIKEYKDSLILYINGYVHNIRLAEELTEDTFVKIGIKKPKYNSKKASFKTWLFTIARNTALDCLRKKSTNAEIPLDDCTILAEETELEKAYIRKEQLLSVHHAMKKIAPQYRQILWLIYFENFSIREASLIIKKSVHSTETLVYRARMSLKSELEKEGFQYEEL